MSDNLAKKVGVRNSEDIEIIIRKSLWSKFWSIFFSTLVILVAFFLIYPLFQYGWYGIGSFFLIAIFGLLLVYRTFITYYHTAIILTSTRLIDSDRSGFFKNSISVVRYARIQSVDFKSRGVFNSLIRTGTIFVTFKGDKMGRLAINKIKKPQKVVNLILSQQEQYQRQKRAKENVEAMRILKKIRKKLGEEKYNRLID